ncbi:hypothetical protein ACIB24_03120 [Spongisporangium articulatum]|uniref:Uncharacterized protein n=1 Tax=Spongisporangium articulatum TaxID=3362603 RepID=A0ABW8AI71_9ACTN
MRVNSAQHKQTAEELLARVASAPPGEVAHLIAQAQVHATLAGLPDVPSTPAVPVNPPLNLGERPDLTETVGSGAEHVVDAQVVPDPIPRQLPG